MILSGRINIMLHDNFNYVAFEQLGLNILLSQLTNKIFFLPFKPKMLNWQIKTICRISSKIDSVLLR